MPRPEGCVDSNDHKSSADSRTCSVLCFRRGFQPGERAVRSCGYDRSARDLLFGRTAEPLNLGRFAVRFGPSPSPVRRVTKAHRAPRQTLWVSGWLGKSVAVWNETFRRLVVNMRILHLNENRNLTRDSWTRENESIRNPKSCPPPEPELLDRLAPNWQVRLHDGAVIDHILEMINKPRKAARSHAARPSSSIT